MDRKRPTGASQIIKDAGLKSAKQVADMTGVSVRTMNNWVKTKPSLLMVVIDGCLARLEKGRNTNRKYLVIYEDGNMWLSGELAASDFTEAECGSATIFNMDTRQVYNGDEDRWDDIQENVF